MNRELHEPHESFTLSASNVERDGVRCRNGHAIPVFATAAHGAILVSMPTLEINATQPWLISQSGIVAEISGKFGGADQLRNAMLYRQTTLRNHLRRTRDLLLPRLLSGQVELETN